LGGIEVFEAFAINDAFQSLRIGICELAEHAEESPQILKAAAQQTPVLARAQIWKRQPQVALARASQPGGKIVGAPGHDCAYAQTHVLRQRAKGSKQQSGSRVFQIDLQV